MDRKESLNLTELKSCGIDVHISPLAVIRRPQLVSIGNHGIIDEFVIITTAAELGDFVHLPPFCSIIGGARGFFKTGHFATMAAGCRIICGSDEHLGAGLVGPRIPDEYKDNIIFKPVIFEPFSAIATNVVVLPGVTLGQGSVVGANSLVTHDTEPWTIYYGTPAKPVKTRRKDKILENAMAMGYEF